MSQRTTAALFLDGFYDDRYPNFYITAARAPETFRVCADGALSVWEGWRERFGDHVAPDLVVGDFDSLADEERALWESRGVVFDTTWAGITDKDDTDGQLALRAALNVGCVRFEFFGSLPKPGDYDVDHFFGNLFLLSEARARVGERTGFAARLRDPRQSVTLVANRIVIAREGKNLNRVSLIPFGGVARVRRSEGLRWCLDRMTLGTERANALRNEFLPDVAFCSVELETDSAPVVVVHNW
jgi:thiamine pyrophosphokinase